MQTLLVLSNPMFRDTASFALETKFEAQNHCPANAGEAMNLILGGQKYDLIVCEHPYSAESMLKVMQAMNIEIPVVVYLAQDAANLESLKAPRLLGFIKGAEVLPTLIQLAQPIYENVRLEENARSSISFCRIHFDLVKNQSTMPCDVYMKTEADGFSVLFRKGEKFSEPSKQKIINTKKPEYLYVQKEEANLLLTLITSDLGRALASPSFNPQLADQIAVRTQEMTADLIQRVGLTPEVQSMIKTNIVLTIQSIGSSPQLKSLMSRIITDRKKYISAHSVALAQISCAIGAGIEWGSTSTFQKLTLASFLHDIVVENQDLAMAQTKEQIDKFKGTISDEVLKDYLLHPVRASQLAQKFPELPPDVDIIISQHHERPDGSGFPRGLTRNQISPLSSIFIVAHDLVSAVYDTTGPFDMDEFVSTREELYSFGNFKKALQALKDQKEKEDLAAAQAPSKPST